MKIFKEAELVWRYLKPYKNKIAAFSSLAVFGSLISASLPYIYGKITDFVIKGVEPKFILGLLGFWLILTLIADLVDRNMETKGHYLAHKISVNTLLLMINHLFDLPLRFHKNKKMGEVVSRVDRAAEYIEMMTHHIVFQTIPQFLTLVAALGIITAIEWRFSLFLVLILLLYGIVTIRGTKPIIKNQKIMNKVWQDSYGDLYDSILNAGTVKSFTRENYEKKKMADNFRGKVSKKFSFHMRLWHSLTLRQQTILSFGFVFLFGVALFFLRQGTFTAGQLVMFVGYIRMSYTPFDRLARYYKDFRQGIAVIESASKMLEEKPEEYRKEGFKTLEESKGEIEFKNVSFCYKKGKNILENISFKVSPGETVALVGQSGVGKSTLVDLISRYYLPQKGEVLFDGINVAEIDLKSLRSQIAIVPQEIMLFNDTIKNNIRYGRVGAKNEEIIAAAKTANAQGFIESFPQKYRQVVGERGVKLSMGQKQRVAIARAILRNPKILILDEATSNLDAESERLVHEALEKLIHQRTTFIIAHRLSTVKKADKIIVLENGKMAEIGNHEKLMRKEGVYFKLYSLQII